MTDTSTAATLPEIEDRPDPNRPSARSRRVSSALRYVHFRNASAIYLFAVEILIFGIWTPSTFLSSGTARSLADAQAVTTILALGLVVSLAAGVYDLSIGLTLGASNITVAWALGVHGYSVVPAVALGIGVGVVVGLVNAFLIVVVGIASFIATLATSSVLTAYITWRSDNQQIVIQNNKTLSRLAEARILGLPWIFAVMLVLAFVLWFILRYRPIGRHLYATGGGPDAARLAGVRTKLVAAGALVICAAIAGLAGALLTLRISIGDPTLGSPYMIPAFTAAFLGSTQFGRGQFNVWGTVIAVYALATGTKGLALVGGPFWLPDLFNGVALALAVGLSSSSVRGGINLRWLRRRGAASAGVLTNPDTSHNKEVVE
jgi:ribose transport system permease protein